MKKKIFTTLIFIGFIYIIFVFGYNPDNFKTSLSFYKENPGLLQIKKDFSNHFPISARLNINHDLNTTAYSKKIMDVGLYKVCNIEFDDESHFFNSVAFPGIKQQLKYELVYAHEISHCADQYTLEEHFYASKDGFEEIMGDIGAWGMSTNQQSLEDHKKAFFAKSKNSKQATLRGEVFADVFSALYVLSKAKDEKDYNFKLNIFKNFIKYRTLYGGGSHDTALYLSKALALYTYESSRGISMKEINEKSNEIKHSVITN